MGCCLKEEWPVPGLLGRKSCSLGKETTEHKEAKAIQHKRNGIRVKMESV